MSAVATPSAAPNLQPVVVPAPGAANAPPAPTPPPTTYVGKFQGGAALEQGFRQLQASVAPLLGLPAMDPSQPLVGQGGLYADHTALETAYKTLESANGRLKAPAATQPANGAPQIGTPAPAAEPGGLQIGAPQETEPSTAEEIITKAGLKEADLVGQWEKNGTLTDEQYAAFRKVNPGLSKVVINELASGRAAKAALKIQALNAAKMQAAVLVGGEQNLKALLDGARAFVPEGEIAGFNQMLSDPKTMPVAVRALYAMHQAHVGAGRSAPLVGGTPAPAGTPLTAAQRTDLLRRASANDPAALRELAAIPQSEIDNWKKG